MEVPLAKEPPRLARVATRHAAAGVRQQRLTSAVLQRFAIKDQSSTTLAPLLENAIPYCASSADIPTRCKGFIAIGICDYPLLTV